jgi:hypothetical protein
LETNRINGFQNQPNIHCIIDTEPFDLKKVGFKKSSIIRSVLSFGLSPVLFCDADILFPDGARYILRPWLPGAALPLRLPEEDPARGQAARRP